MQMFIDGKVADAADSATINVINPATAKLIDTVPAATKEDISRTISAARKAQPAWAVVPVHEKVDILLKFLDLVGENHESLAQLLCAETGKPIVEARAEISNITIAFRAFCERAKHLYGQTIPAGMEAGQEHHVLITRREPLGVIVAVIPFNFPCDLFDQKVAPALLAGNAVVVKPSTDNPLTLCRLTALLGAAGIPAGVCQIVTGRGSTVGNWLCSDPGVDAITLTGSTEVGIETARNASAHLIHTALELGGNDAFILLEDGDVDLAVDELVWGRMYNTGQVCCASKRFLIQRSRIKEFTDKAVTKIASLKQGDPIDENSKLGCLISEKAAIKAEDQIKLTVEQGGKIIYGGHRKGAFLEPTVIADVPATADVARDMEIFAPVVPIIGFDTAQEAIQIANSSKFGLCGCVFTSDMKAASEVGRALECGGVVINGASFFRSFEMPFGGYKYSGIGTEGVMSTFDEVTHTKTIVLKNIV